MNLPIETEDLGKRYGTVIAVQQLSLRVAEGEIYAFLGLNGAGKTTTIRMLLGMIKPTWGTAQVLHTRVRLGSREPWAAVGYLVETPHSYPELTVYENLEVARRLHPANGLDPAGIVEIRELLLELTREQGVTVFLASHILAEVSRLAGRIGIIHQGRLLQELDVDELEQKRRRRLLVRAREMETARLALATAGHPAEILPDGTLELTDIPSLEHPDDLARLLVQAGAPPTQVVVEQEDLEQYFLRLLGMHRGQKDA